MVFDSDPQKVGMKLGQFTVQDTRDLEKTIQEAHIQVGMIAVPADHAQEVADLLVKAGIRAILNYAPISINVPQNVYVQYIDPAVHLQRMTYYLD
jgi:redox-sensing transcriptional repressor